MKILVTGASGFIGRNLCIHLINSGYCDILEFNRDSDTETLKDYVKQCDFIFHLAGVNRPKENKEFIEGNFDFTKNLLDLLIKYNRSVPIVFSSTIQVDQENAYGRSKLMAEHEVRNYQRQTGAKVIIYRLCNVFGKWCRPNYNSVVATFCHNIARNLPIQINDKEVVLQLAYIDDVISSFIGNLSHNIETNYNGFAEVEKKYYITLGDIARKIQAFKESRKTLVMPLFESEFDRALYATYVSYLHDNDFAYDLTMKKDDRGWLAEFMKTHSCGQVFVSRTKPGVTRGMHYHHTKVEKFLVVQGYAVLKFQRIDSEEILEYYVDGAQLKVVDIPVGYTHSIANIGQEDLITIFWADEVFDSNKPDTIYKGMV